MKKIPVAKQTSDASRDLSECVCKSPAEASCSDRGRGPPVRSGRCGDRRGAFVVGSKSVALDFIGCP